MRWPSCRDALAWLCVLAAAACSSVQGAAVRPGGLELAAESPGDADSEEAETRAEAMGAPSWRGGAAPARPAAAARTSAAALPAVAQSGAAVSGAAVAPMTDTIMQVPAQQPMIVYSAYLKLRVRRELEAVDQLTAMAKASGGYVQSVSGAVVVLRVPAGDFDQVLQHISSVGELLDRRIQAADVGRQYLDTEARLHVAVQARQRLLALLEKVRNHDERLRVLEQIKRLTETIEVAEASLAAMRHMVEYFTLTVELQAMVSSTTTGIPHRSPFAWIRALNPYAQTLSGPRTLVSLRAPQGFVLFDQQEQWRAQAADTSVLRAGRVANEPQGDAAFWSAAIHHELDGRDEELVDQRSLGRVHLRVYRNKDLRPRYFVVAVTVVDHAVWVVEGLLPDEAAWTRHRDALLQSIATLEVQP